MIFSREILVISRLSDLVYLPDTHLQDFKTPLLALNHQRDTGSRTIILKNHDTAIALYYRMMYRKLAWYVTLSI